MITKEKVLEILAQAKLDQLQGTFHDKADEIIYKASQEDAVTWWKMLSEEELLYVGFLRLRYNFGSLQDKEINNIIDALELTGFPRASLEHLARNNTHFIGEILEFINTSPFVVYQQKRLADLMEENNKLLREISIVLQSQPIQVNSVKPDLKSDNQKTEERVARRPIKNETNSQTTNSPV